MWTRFFPDDVIKWKHLPRYWSFVRGIHRSSVNSPHKGQWRRSSMLSLICAWINRWVNNRAAGDLRRHRAHYDVIVMPSFSGYRWFRIIFVVTSSKTAYEIWYFEAQILWILKNFTGHMAQFPGPLNQISRSMLYSWCSAWFHRDLHIANLWHCVSIRKHYWFQWMMPI